jgi:hypothetical protein
MIAASHASSKAKGDSMTPDEDDDSELELLLLLFAISARIALDYGAIIYGVLMKQTTILY